MSFVIFGAPRTKKNSSRLVRAKGRQMIIPSIQYKNWLHSALPQMRIIWAGRPPIERPVNVAAMFYRDALRGDAVGYYQALADGLEAAGVVKDDKWIVSWDGSRMCKDSDRPRIEVGITEAA